MILHRLGTVEHRSFLGVRGTVSNVYFQMSFLSEIRENVICGKPVRCHSQSKESFASTQNVMVIWAIL